MKENDKAKNVEKSGAKSSKEQPHIIRRQVTIIKTEESAPKSNKVVDYEITKESRPAAPRSNNTQNGERRPYNNNNQGQRSKFLNNKNSSVVIMKNGKKVEDVKEVKEVKEVKKVEAVKEKIEEVKVVKEIEVKKVELDDTKTVAPEEKAAQTTKETSVEKKPFVRTNTQSGERRPYNNNDGERRPYNNNNSGERRPYNNNNSGERRPYNNNNDGERRPYNNNNSGERRPYNNNNDGERRPYNNTNSGERRPYNNNNDGERRPYNNNNSGERRPYNSNYNNNNNGGERRPYNNNGGAQTGERRPYNSNYQGGERRPYNNNSNDGERRPYNNNYNNNNSNSGERRPYNNNYNNNNNNGGERRPYNNNYNNNNNASGERRPYNNNYGNNNGGERRPYNNNGGGRFNNDGNSSYQVNKFIKTAEKLPIEQKEMKEYSQNLITKDKERFNGENKSIDKKQDKKNKNAIREQNSRVDLAKIKGLEVDTNKGMYELYDRNIDRRRARKTRRVREESKQTLIIPMTEVTLPEEMTVKMFAESIKKTSAEVIKKLFKLGILATLNQEIDFDTAFLIAEEYGITAKKEVVVTEEDILFDESEDKEDELESRPPIVVVMGHVDHGKTSILDRIRKANVQSGEAGGITQHIGAYKVKVQDKEITFLDTPGHEAFTAMRARGAQVTDIAIIVVAADDGIMPQTVEAINHAKAAEVSIIVAINKIDKPGANIDKVKQELLEAGLVPEEWGGDTICVPVSAVTGEGMDTLLEMVLLVAEVKDLKSNPNKQAKGTVIEAKLDKNKGTVASLLVQRGSLNVGDTIVCGEVIGRVRAMTDDKGRKVKVAGPSTPVEIMGLSSVPETGDIFYEVENEKVAKQLIEKRKGTKRATLIKQGAKVTLEDLFSQIKQGEVKDLNVIIKADLQGSVQALKDSLEKISNEEVRVRVIHGAAGAISESDVTLAMVSNAIIIGFNVRPNAVAASIAEKEKVNLRLYRVIYDAINDVQAAMKGMLAPTFKEVVHGTAEVRSIFKITDVGTVCGCYVKSGKVIRNGLIRVIRDNVVIAEDKIDSLKRMKDDAKEVAENYECGIKLDKFNDIKELDTLECFELVEEKK